MRSSALEITLWCLVASVSILAVSAEESTEFSRIDSPVDESSCICGLNREILERLETILRYSTPANSCERPTVSAQKSDQQSSIDKPSDRDDTDSSERPDGPKKEKDKEPQVSSTNEDDRDEDGELDKGDDDHGRDKDKTDHDPGQQDHKRPSPSNDDQEVSRPNKYSEVEDEKPKPKPDVTTEAPAKPTNSLFGLPAGITIPTSAEDFLSQLQGLQNQIVDLAKPGSMPGSVSIKPQPSNSVQQNSKPVPSDQTSVSSSTESQQVIDSSQQIQLLQQQQLLLQQLYQQQLQLQLQQQQIPIQQSTSQLVKPTEGQNANLISSLLPQISISGSGNSQIQQQQVEQQQVNQNTSQQQANIGRPLSTGFLDGLPQSTVGSENESLMKLNQSTQMKPEEMANAVQSTVPNVVSNIFSNIHDLAVQTEKVPSVQSNNGSSYSLTSIDGSSVNVAGNTVDQITAEGEKLFMQWIEHQLSSLKLTVSAANYIRKNAINLFRRIVRQYIRMIEKLGGSVEDNVRRATQMALSNTEKLTGYLLNHYLNYAGGLMHIIGEQVSRIGKQLDATGGTIATLSLNPFDIISNVMDSLPNPSYYSKYFREFGKYLISGVSPQLNNTESSSSSSSPSTEEEEAAAATTTTGDSGASDGNDQQAGSQTASRPTIFSKTIGALGKTFGWIG